MGKHISYPVRPVRKRHSLLLALAAVRRVCPPILSLASPGTPLGIMLKPTRVRNTFSSLGSDHAFRRRRVSHIYSKEYLRKSPHVQVIKSGVLEACLSQLNTSADNGAPIDFLSLSFAYSLDFMTGMIFGLPQATNFVRDVRERQQWLDLYLRSHPPKDMFLIQELPTLTKWLIRTGIPVISRSSQEGREGLESWALQKVNQAEDGLRETRDSAPVVLAASGDLPLLYHHLKDSIIKEATSKDIAVCQQSLSRQRLVIASECLDHIGMPNPT